MTDAELLGKIKQNLSDEEKKMLDQIVDSGADLNALADSDGDGSADVKGLRALFHKNGEFSKTSVILVLAWSCGLFLWVMQGLFVGVQVFGHTIPAFDSSAALAMLGAASSLYFAANNIKATVGQG
jgi:hypothetical protein